MQCRFPIFIPSLSRADSRLTIKSLQRMGVTNWKVVVEPHQIDQYASVIPRAHILELDMTYKDRYEYLDEFGRTKSSGSGPARNFIWDQAIKTGATHHWIMDDNIHRFSRFHQNLKIEILSPAYFRIMEDFMLRYTNLVMVGPEYEYFIPRRRLYKPILFNTRIFSCNLIRNDIPFRWRGRYNEDAILSLDILKRGYCTAIFKALLQNKAPTQTIKGGNQQELYKKGTAAKSEMLVRTHPDVATLTNKFGREHHNINMKPFRRNLLIRKRGIIFSKEANNYGLELMPRPASASRVIPSKKHTK
jgi:hypothetical protein